MTMFHHVTYLPDNPPGVINFPLANTAIASLPEILFHV